MNLGLLQRCRLIPRVPSTMTERDYTTKDGESRIAMRRGFMKILTALFYWMRSAAPSFGVRPHPVGQCLIRWPASRCG